MFLHIGENEQTKTSSAICSDSSSTYQICATLNLSSSAIS